MSFSWASEEMPDLIQDPTQFFSDGAKVSTFHGRLVGSHIRNLQPCAYACDSIPQVRI